MVVVRGTTDTPNLLLTVRRDAFAESAWLQRRIWDRVGRMPVMHRYALCGRCALWGRYALKTLQARSRKRRVSRDVPDTPRGCACPFPDGAVAISSRVLPARIAM